jgi:hypothetical protein
MPKRSQSSGNLKSMRDIALKWFASVAILFINLNKYSTFRKNFFISSGNSGNKVLSVMTLTRINFLLRSRGPE